jgi:hypothetical protein
LETIQIAIIHERTRMNTNEIQSPIRVHSCPFVDNRFSYLRNLGLITLLALLAATPATHPSSEIVKWLSDLGDKDQSVRTSAHDSLMGLSRDDLPALLDAVKQARPLLPSQSSGLREIVQQVYLSGEPYEKQNSGFLGVMLGDSIVSVDGSPRQGVQVQFRWPGCAGYRYLQDGDIIVGVDEFSPVGVDRVHFVDSVKKCEPGSTLTFRILRQSRVVPIRVTLGARPAGDAEAGIETVMENWLLKEAVYWRKNFAPVVEESSEGTK